MRNGLQQFPLSSNEGLGAMGHMIESVCKGPRGLNATFVNPSTQVAGCNGLGRVFHASKLSGNGTQQQGNGERGRK